MRLSSERVPDLGQLSIVKALKAKHSVREQCPISYNARKGFGRDDHTRPAEITCAAPCDRILPVAPHAHTPRRLDARLRQRRFCSTVDIVYRQTRQVERYGGQDG